MSRKSAYLLKARDPAFASAWAAAANAAHRVSGEGDKVDEVEGDPVSSSQRYALPSRSERERSFARLVGALRDSPSLAPDAPAQ